MEQLAAFSTPQIKRILKVTSLEDDVLEALMLVKRLGPDVKEGKRRQFNYIGDGYVITCSCVLINRGYSFVCK
ncbi:hypothetical protein Q3G72_017192 [Acer saccharum]|nr:hypothetical protein Q3G72_017192 [Acer saccharum]